MKMDELFIGMTIGAIGPSIPNIMAAYQATRKGMYEVAVSGTLGSNIFTLLVTLGILSIMKPIEITQEMLMLDLPAILIMSVFLFIFMITRKVISRVEGAILIGCYVVFLLIKILILKNI